MKNSAVIDSEIIPDAIITAPINEAKNPINSQKIALDRSARTPIKTPITGLLYNNSVPIIEDSS